ncbi:MAG: proline--tRNA ligase [Cyanobacteria bacterium]|nr:proline--tRNA ligase [Cyanobacteriota bacterium]MDA1020275.1 proline--tRNA ligase [Cyanobacteriota bacterium]
MSTKAKEEQNTAESTLADIALKAQLADYSPVKGCMVIRPYGYAIWERIKEILDKMIKDTGHENAYFPMLIPESFLQKEAEHVEGFAPECAVVTHAGGKELTERYVLRPTSETIINHMFSKWIESYRDLPMKLNQWANVVRWEMRTRLFMRTSEFLWQEGHTCHATWQEAQEETTTMLACYKTLLEKYLAVPVHTGKKTESERFAGAEATYTIEAMMRDGKALQAGTSHNLGQNFAKAFETQFTNDKNQLEYVYQTSWGVSTRLIGALVMGHHDDVGLILPPEIAPYQVVVIPILKKNQDNTAILEAAKTINSELQAEGIRTKLDDRLTISQGHKFNEYEQKGVPIRLVIGPRDLEEGKLEVHRRDIQSKEKDIPRDGIASRLKDLLAQIQNQIWQRAIDFRTEHTTIVQSLEELEVALDKPGGFARAMWNGDTELEKILKDKFKATIRCMPDDKELDASKHPCVLSGESSTNNVEILVARAY